MTARFTTITQLPATDLVRARTWYADMLGLLPVTACGEVIEPGDADPWTYMLAIGSCAG